MSEWTPDELDQWWDNRSREEQEAIANRGVLACGGEPTDEEVEAAAKATDEIIGFVGPVTDRSRLMALAALLAARAVREE